MIYLKRRCRSEAKKKVNEWKNLPGGANDRQDGGQYQGIPSGRRKRIGRCTVLMK